MMRMSKGQSVESNPDERAPAPSSGAKGAGQSQSHPLLWPSPHAQHAVGASTGQARPGADMTVTNSPPGPGTCTASEAALDAADSRIPREVELDPYAICFKAWLRHSDPPTDRDCRCRSLGEWVARLCTRDAKGAVAVSKGRVGCNVRLGDRQLRRGDRLPLQSRLRCAALGREEAERVELPLTSELRVGAAVLEVFGDDAEAPAREGLASR
eukprot:scaffold140973_cov27-Tisochrysis_lutea.AAC.2